MARRLLPRLRHKPRTFGAGEEPRLSTEGNRRIILPISGRKLRFIIGGMRSMDVRCGAITARSAAGLTSSSSKENLALRLSWRHGCLTRRLVREWRSVRLTFQLRRLWTFIDC
jgi:hypothetical protein